jgi:putative FmdB family regulatory protein
MPTYDYECQNCEHHFELVMKISEYDTDLKPPCPECGAEKQSTRVFTPPMINFSGDGWSTKNGRIAAQMRDKNKRLAAKEREQKGDGMIPSLAPNVGGERVDSWSEAAKLARSQGKDTTGYESRARKEKAGSA